ncbi:UPF0280 family protein [Stappia sp. BW2]|uniref:UPF0280 family protein n=1 Tax=Stappia sp. BW2 TaxID=2592622 RepID=UPI001966E6A0|nr:UPF0280 family protein [Stappia sp. BW2]
MTRAIQLETATAHLLPDARRLHLQHGPIDLVVEACGEPGEVAEAYRRARAAFETVLQDLVGEISRLRSPDGPAPKGRIARAMWAATSAYAPDFITPMAAVAGSVADHILKELLKGRSLGRAYVNNGGDIALHLAEGSFRIGICDDPVTGVSGGVVHLRPEDGIGGIATSGWRGRSHSLGIADAVTVLAKTAAEADAAATMIANRVDLPGNVKIEREAASRLSPDSDLGDLAVTTGVGPLSPDEIQIALEGGVKAAHSYLAGGLFSAAYLALAGERCTVAATPGAGVHQYEIRNMREAVCA